ncbi:hypothetical protein C8J56DRAFT_988711, partial [Mycena floridula]
MRFAKSVKKAIVRIFKTSSKMEVHPQPVSSLEVVESARPVIASSPGTTAVRRRPVRSPRPTNVSQTCSLGTANSRPPDLLPSPALSLSSMFSQMTWTIPIPSAPSVPLVPCDSVANIVWSMQQQIEALKQAVVDRDARIITLKEKVIELQDAEKEMVKENQELLRSEEMNIRILQSLGSDFITTKYQETRDPAWMMIPEISISSPDSIERPRRRLDFCGLQEEKRVRMVSTLFWPRLLFKFRRTTVVFCYPQLSSTIQTIHLSVRASVPPAIVDSTVHLAPAVGTTSFLHRTVLLIKVHIFNWKLPNIRQLFVAIMQALASFIRYLAHLQYNSDQAPILQLLPGPSILIYDQAILSTRCSTVQFTSKRSL